MYSLNFEYDGNYLSDFGFIVCAFDYSSGTTNVSAGSEISFNTVSRNSGKHYGLTSTTYDSCIRAEFDICKNPELHDDLTISNDEYRDLMRWLNRRKFLPFRIENEDDTVSDTCYYDASFNIEKIKIAEKLCGLHLTMETNRPFGYGATVKNTWSISDTATVCKLYDISDEIGEIYPDVEITVNEDGNLTVYNELTDCTMYIANCTNGEVITIHGLSQIIESSVSGHDIANDFNFIFLKIGNTIDDRLNEITVSLACDLTISYAPIIKDSP